VSSKITTLIVKLNIWSVLKFNKKEITNNLILALFFGVMIFVIFYNTIVLLITKELNYLYFILFFITVSFHHLMYKGIATLYFSPEIMAMLISCSSCIVALPIIFLALFTQRILELKKHPLCNKYLKYIFLLYPLSIAIIWITEEHQYRSIFVLLILVYLFFIASYSFLKKNKQAPLLFFSWIVFITSGIFMYFSSLGIYDIFTKYPYYVEAIWIFAILIFSLKILTFKIKALEEAQYNTQKSNLNFKELKHRVNNHTQTILNFLLFQKDNIKNETPEEVLTSLENRIMITSEIFSLLNEKNNTELISINEYFSLITNKLKESFEQKHINIYIHSHVTMPSKNAIHCCKIVNEAVTNSFKYAFKGLNSGKIEISLTEIKGNYHLTVKDNGHGFKNENQNGLGLNIIKKLATLQLDGNLTIEKDKGVKINIVWRKDEE
jgi:two-component sensor histidine kinase